MPEDVKPSKQKVLFCRKIIEGLGFKQRCHSPDFIIRCNGEYENPTLVCSHCLTEYTLQQLLQSN